MVNTNDAFISKLDETSFEVVSNFVIRGLPSLSFLFGLIYEFYCVNVQCSNVYNIDLSLSVYDTIFDILENIAC